MSEIVEVHTHTHTFEWIRYLSHVRRVTRDMWEEKEKKRKIKKEKERETFNGWRYVNK